MSSDEEKSDDYGKYFSAFVIVGVLAINRWHLASCGDSSKRVPPTHHVPAMMIALIHEFVWIFWKNCNLQGRAITSHGFYSQNPTWTLIVPINHGRKISHRTFTFFFRAGNEDTFQDDGSKNVLNVSHIALMEKNIQNFFLTLTVSCLILGRRRRLRARWREEEVQEGQKAQSDEGGKVF